MKLPFMNKTQTAEASPAESKPLRVVAYAAALDDARQQGHVFTVETYCQEQGFECISTIVEHDHTKSLGRPGLQEALDMLEAGAADALVVAELSQVALSARDLISLCSTHFESNTLISVAEDICYPAKPAPLMMTIMLSMMDSADGKQANPRLRSTPRAAKPESTEPSEIQKRLAKDREERDRPKREMEAEARVQANLQRGQAQLLAAAFEIDRAQKLTPDDRIALARKEQAEKHAAAQAHRFPPAQNK